MARINMFPVFIPDLEARWTPLLSCVSLLVQGRCAVYVAPPPEEAEEGEEEEHQPTEEEAEESPAPLTTLDNDAELPTGGKPWAVALSSDIPGLKHKVRLQMKQCGHRCGRAMTRSEGSMLKD